MKRKSLVMLMVSGLCVASLAYVAPAMADDMNDNDSKTMQQAAPAENPMGSNLVLGSNDRNDNLAGPATVDQGNSPDTASGEDDY